MMKRNVALDDPKTEGGGKKVGTDRGGSGYAQTKNFVASGGGIQEEKGGEGVRSGAGELGFRGDRKRGRRLAQVGGGLKKRGKAGKKDQEGARRSRGLSLGTPRDQSRGGVPVKGGGETQARSIRDWAIKNNAYKLLLRLKGGS